MTVKKPDITSPYTISWNIAAWGRSGTCRGTSSTWTFRPESGPRYLVIHFTGGTGDSYKAMSRTYSSMQQRKATCHYLVGEQIWELVNPSRMATGYSCGTLNEDAYNATWAPTALPNVMLCPDCSNCSLSRSHAGKVGNGNSINIEICSRKTDGCMALANYGDPDWHFSDKTYANAVMTAGWVLDKYGIEIGNMIMHNQVSGKLCPAMWCRNETALGGWYRFVEDVRAYILDGTTPTQPTGSPVSMGVLDGTPIYSDSSGETTIGYIQGDTTLEIAFVGSICSVSSDGRWIDNGGLYEL